MYKLTFITSGTSGHFCFASQNVSYLYLKIKIQRLNNQKAVPFAFSPQYYLYLTTIIQVYIDYVYIVISNQKTVTIAY